jgi:hypothetical protein
MAACTAPIVFALLCSLAVASTVGSGEVKLESGYKIKGAPGSLRGMNLMIAADDVEWKSELAIRLDESTEHMAPTEFRKYLVGNFLKWTQLSAGPNSGEFEQLTMAHQLQQLIDWSKADGSACSRDQLKWFLLANKLDTSMEPALAGYLNHFGKTKVTNCAPKARTDIAEKDPAELLVEYKFDRFYRALFELPEGASDSQLYERLSAANLLADNLNFDAAKRFALSLHYSEDKQPAERIRDFFESECPSLSFHVGAELAAINLANAFGAKVERDAGLLKLDEYDHACWYVTKRQDKFAEHLRLAFPRAGLQALFESARAKPLVHATQLKAQ